MSQTCHNRTRVPQQIGMLSSSVWAVQKISGWWQIAPSPNYSQASHITVPRHTIIDLGSLPAS